MHDHLPAAATHLLENCAMRSLASVSTSTRRRSTVRSERSTGWDSSSACAEQALDSSCVQLRRWYSASCCCWCSRATSWQMGASVGATGMVVLQGGMPAGAEQGAGC
jgi:hypothetical protein